MPHLNFEFKARISDLDQKEKKLLTLNPEFIGTDNQTDTYFNVPKGRLKLREGNIENALIYYERDNSASAKQSKVILYKHNPNGNLKDILIHIHGILATVIKRRKIYFIANVKFHFDEVEGLGTFIEVEAIDVNGETGIEKLRQQAAHYLSFFEISEQDLIAHSYSDMLSLGI